MVQAGESDAKVVQRLNDNEAAFAALTPDAVAGQLPRLQVRASVCGHQCGQSAELMCAPSASAVKCCPLLPLTLFSHGAPCADVFGCVVLLCCCRRRWCPLVRRILLLLLLDCVATWRRLMCSAMSVQVCVRANMLWQQGQACPVGCLGGSHHAMSMYALHRSGCTPCTHNPCCSSLLTSVLPDRALCTSGLEEAVREMKGRDNILPKLMACGSGATDALFERELKKYEPLAADVAANATRNQELLSALTRDAQVCAVPAACATTAQWRTSAPCSSTY